MALLKTDVPAVQHPPLMPPDPPAATAAETVGHRVGTVAGRRTTLVEVGAFAHAGCQACDWRGPGRRARSRAREDGEAHTLLGTC